MIGKVIEQYKSHDNLDIRVELHKKYSKNKLGFNNWIFSNYQITDEVKVLELGCGTGELWKSNLNSINKMKQLIITDFSNDMVETTKLVIGNRDNVNYERMDIQNISFVILTNIKNWINFLCMHIKKYITKSEPSHRVPSGKRFALSFKLYTIFFDNWNMIQYCRYAH